MLKSNPGALDIHQTTLDQILPDVRRHWFPKEQQLRWQDSIKKISENAAKEHRK